MAPVFMTLARCIPVFALAFGSVVGIASAEPLDGEPDCGSSVDVEFDGDACAGVLAVSVTGNAEGACANGIFVAFVSVRCVSASGTGSATNNAGDSSCGLGVGVQGAGAGLGCVAASGTGNATNNAGDFSCGFGFGSGSLGAGAGLGCVAASVTGEAENTRNGQHCTTHVDSGGAGCIRVAFP